MAIVAQRPHSGPISGLTDEVSGAAARLDHRDLEITHIAGLRVQGAGIAARRK
jgi:hypothetical protein